MNEEITVNVGQATAKRIRTSKDLSDFMSYVEGKDIGKDFLATYQYNWPESEQGRIMGLFDDIRYLAGRFDHANVSRILGWEADE